MSGSTLPYALRQNKYVDRRVFLDLLRRFQRYRDLDNYVYVSLGGPSLEDHKLIHTDLGLTRLVSLDGDADVVARQMFNRPAGCVRCRNLTTKQFVDQFRPELRNMGYGDDAPVVIWFDYTAPKDLGHQIQEFQALLGMLEAGDIVRVTVNANPSALYTTNSRPIGRRETAEEARELRFERLRRRLAEFAPPEATADDMTDEGLPRVLALAFSRASLAALPSTAPNVFAPASVIRYADGHQMLSMTGIVLARGSEREFVRTTGLGRWKFFSKTWSDVHVIDIPYLTLRERLYLDQMLPKLSPKQMRRKLSFSFDGDPERTLDVLTQYKQYYRYYPHYHQVTF